MLERLRLLRTFDEVVPAVPERPAPEVDDEIDLAIAACAILWEAELWTLNASDFEDNPDLRLTPPA